jgi:hypothetical protein
MTVIRDPKLENGRTSGPPVPPPSVLVSWARWFMVFAVVALALLVWQLLALRGQVASLDDKVTNLRDAAQPAQPPAPVTTAPPVDLPPPDAETARRSINDSYKAVFSTATPPERWRTFVADPGDQGARLSTLRSGRCSGATAVVTDIRFTGDDTAAVTFRFEGSGVSGAEGVTFTGGARRAPDRWLVTTDGIDRVVNTAAGFCQGG